MFTLPRATVGSIKASDQSLISGLQPYEGDFLSGMVHHFEFGSNADLECKLTGETLVPQNGNPTLGSASYGAGGDEVRSIIIPSTVGEGLLVPAAASVYTDQPWCAFATIKYPATPGSSTYTPFVGNADPAAKGASFGFKSESSGNDKWVSRVYEGASGSDVATTFTGNQVSGPKVILIGVALDHSGTNKSRYYYDFSGRKEYVDAVSVDASTYNTQHVLGNGYDDTGLYTASLEIFSFMIGHFVPTIEDYTMLLAREKERMRVQGVTLAG